MKVVCHELAQASSDPEGSSMDELARDADRLVLCLATKVRTVLFWPPIFWIFFLPIFVNCLPFLSVCIGCQDF